MPTTHEHEAPAAAAEVRTPFADGARAVTPLVLGAVPFALAIGAAASGLGVDRWATWVGSWSMVAGTAQLTAMQLLHEGAAPVVALVAALVVNARFAVYSAGLARWFPSASRRQRMLLALPLVDQVFMTATAEFERRPMDDRQRRAFYLGAASHFALAWVAGQTAGLLIGDRVPEWLGLHTASVLALVGLLATSIRHRPACTAAVVAAAVAVAGSHLPAHAAVLVATIAGITVGAARRPS